MTPKYPARKMIPAVLAATIETGGIMFSTMRTISSRLGKKAGAAAATTVLVGGLMIANVAPASAAGYSYDGTDPAVTGCANNSTPIASGILKDPFTGANTGQWEVRYSNSCGTNWVRAYSYNSSYVVEKVIQRGNAGYKVQDNDVYAGWTYSRQLYAPGATCINVGVMLNDGSFNHGSVYKTIC